MNASTGVAELPLGSVVLLILSIVDCCDRLVGSGVVTFG